MINFIKSAKYVNDYPVSNKEIIFVGKSNVGKSSLINALFGKIAYVGKTPGKTRLINFYNINNNYTVCDVPGYGYAKRNDNELIEYGKMMEEYFIKRSCLKLCIIILDIRREPNQDDIDMIDYLKQLHIPFRLVVNKIDKLSYSQKLSALNLIANTLNINKDILIEVSCLNKTNINILKDIIEKC